MVSGHSLAELEAAAELVHRTLPLTPQFHWPLLSQRAGCEVWVKHENHTPLGAFKVRGGLVYMDWLRQEHPHVTGVITATRGNHGQSVAFAARQFGVRAKIVVPHGNSREKNAAMRALGAELIEHGHDFQAASEHAAQLAETYSLHRVPSFHPLLVRGVASYALEFFRGCRALDAVYVPVGMGSGICGLMAARDALGLKTEIIGVVSRGAPAYALSFAAGHPVATERADTFVDGVACRQPDALAVEAICRGAARVIQVSDAEVAAAMCALYQDTHNLAEPAVAAAFAGLMQEREQMKHRKVGVVLTGANLDLEVFREVLNSCPDESAKRLVWQQTR
ncbi:MAG: threonine dehydratase [Verrucomicrobia bacterium]|nr:threonine dehydratase [Verrucomicrobiota bacterium]